MAGTKRLVKSFTRLLMPVIIVSVVAILVASVWLVHEASQPFKASYLVSPATYGQLSSRGAQVTEETWTNRDGSSARGWLLRGIPNGPAVVLLHRFGADRSHLLNLGVKLSESTNFTVLMPDMRGHGESPALLHSSFGGCEGDDTNAAIDYLRTLRSPEDLPLVGSDIGIYGVEMGAIAAVAAAAKDPTIKALALDSAPYDSDSLVAGIISKRYPFASSITSRFASLGAYPYYYQGCYRRVPTCEMAKAVSKRRTMLLGGVDEPDYQESTSRLSKCFPVDTTVDAKTDLSPSGIGISTASMELSEAYDQRVIDFLKIALTTP